MTLYIIRTRSAPHKFWLARGTGTTANRMDAYRFTHKQVGAVIHEFAAGWFKSCMVVIPVEVS